MCAESVTVQLFGVFKNGVSGKQLKKKKTSQAIQVQII